jgi:hypothetical protein
MCKNQIAYIANNVYITNIVLKYSKALKTNAC